MKFNKKILSMLLSATMMLNMVTPAFAVAAPVADSGKAITQYEHHKVHDADCSYTTIAVSSFTVTAFEALTTQVQMQSVAAKTALSMLNLPTALKATSTQEIALDSGTPNEVVSTEITLTDITWELTAENNNGTTAYDEQAEQGSYIFTPVLPDDCTLGAGVELPQIYVQVGSVNALATYAAGELDVKDSSGNAVNPTNDIYTLRSGSYTISGSTTKEHIVAEPANGETLDITMNGVTLDGVCAFEVKGEGKTILTLAQNSTNTIISRGSAAGISAVGKDFTITATDESGKLEIFGGHGGTGYGGTGIIGGNISGGSVKATGGKGNGGGGAGISGGNISGGSVKATGGNGDFYSKGGGAGISGGNISGGSVEATGGSSGDYSKGGAGISGGSISGGSVNATGGKGETYSNGGAGISGGNISGGSVNATGGKGNTTSNGGTGISGGSISGGSVNANGGKGGTNANGGAGISGGSISGGSVKATGGRGGNGGSDGPNTENMPAGTPAEPYVYTFSGMANQKVSDLKDSKNNPLKSITNGNYGENDVFIDDDNKIYLWHTNTNKLGNMVTCNGDIYDSDAVGTMTIRKIIYDLTVKDSSGNAVNPTNDIYTLRSGSYTISGSTTKEHIVAEPANGETLDITMNGVTLDPSGANGVCAFEVKGEGKTILTLAQNSTNTIKSGGSAAGISAVGKDFTITSTDENGKLEAFGGYSGVGISGGNISGGSVNATSGYGSAGIENCSISGGCVKANGGIGGGGTGISNCNISGGSVNATGGFSNSNSNFGGDGISGGSISDGIVNATGGNGSDGGGTGISGGSISGGSVNATGGRGGDGISGGSINGGSVNATGGIGASNSNGGGAGISGGNINGGSVNATGGRGSNMYSNGGAGISGGSINGGSVNATGGNGSNMYSNGGAGISGGSINGGSVNATGGRGASNSNGGAGISGGSISGGSVKATGGRGGNGGSDGPNTENMPAGTPAEPYVYTFSGMAKQKVSNLKDSKNNPLKSITNGNYGENDVFIDDDNKIYLWHTNTNKLGNMVTCNGDIYDSDAVGTMTIRKIIYDLTVNDGTATPAKAEAGTIMSITANAPETGKLFDKWITKDGVTFTDANAESTTITMPSKNITVTATYKKAPPTVTSVTVSPTTADVVQGKTQLLNAVVTGTNNPATTVTWSVTGATKTGTSITDGLLTVAADETATSLTVTATSTQDPTMSGMATVSVIKAQYTLTVADGTGNGNFEADTIVSITANAPETGKLFDKWVTNDGVIFADANAESTTITMPSKNITVTATYKNSPPIIKHTITASAERGGTISPSGDIFVVDGKNHTFNISANNGYSILSVIVDGVSQGAISSYTFSNVIGDHTISAKFIRNMKVENSTNRPDTSINNEEATLPTKITIEVNATVDKNGNASVTVTDKTLADGIKKANEEAKKNGTEKNGISVELNINTGKKKVNSLSVNLAKSVQDLLINEKINEFTISSVLVGLTFDNNALSEIRKQADGDALIEVSRADVSKLSKEAQDEIGNRPVFNFSITGKNGKAISDFGDGLVTVSIPYTLQPNENPENLQAYFIDSKGKLHEVTCTYDPVTKCLIFVTNHFSVYGIGYKKNAPKFNDIKKHWAKNDIEFVTARGLLSGTDKNTFSPNSSITRGMFVTALGRLARIDTSNYKNGKFTDVKADAYYAPYVNWATNKGITNGITATMFSPDKTVTRQEMAVFMTNYAKATGYTVPKTRDSITFSDHASIANWAEESVKSMQMAGVIMSKDGNRFDPNAIATRAEVSAILRRYVELVIDKATAQGFDMNDSGKLVYYENGKLFPLFFYNL